jgi:hypothetical protein
MISPQETIYKPVAAMLTSEHKRLPSSELQLVACVPEGCGVPQPIMRLEKYGDAGKYIYYSVHWQTHSQSSQQFLELVRPFITKDVQEKKADRVLFTPVYSRQDDLWKRGLILVNKAEIVGASLEMVHDRWEEVREFLGMHHANQGELWIHTSAGRFYRGTNLVQRGTERVVSLSSSLNMSAFIGEAYGKLEMDRKTGVHIAEELDRELAVFSK